MDTQIKKNRQIKEETVESLSAKIKDSKSIVFSDYRGLKANDITTLRDKIKDAGGEMVIAKNNLLKIALKNNKLETKENSLTGPTAVVFSYTDEIAPVKEIADSKKTLGLPHFKFGFLEGEILTESALESLAKIPSRDVLYAKVVGALSSPIYGVVSVLGANIRNLVNVLDQAAKKGITA